MSRCALLAGAGTGSQEYSSWHWDICRNCSAQAAAASGSPGPCLALRLWRATGAQRPSAPRGRHRNQRGDGRPARCKPCIWHGMPCLVMQPVYALGSSLLASRCTRTYEPCAPYENRSFPSGHVPARLPSAHLVWQARRQPSRRGRHALQDEAMKYRGMPSLRRVQATGRVSMC